MRATTLCNRWTKWKTISALERIADMGRPLAAHIGDISSLAGSFAAGLAPQMAHLTAAMGG
jgi:hypothetical protein